MERVIVGWLLRVSANAVCWRPCSVPRAARTAVQLTMLCRRRCAVQRILLCVEAPDLGLRANTPHSRSPITANRLSPEHQSPKGAPKTITRDPLQGTPLDGANTTQMWIWHVPQATNHSCTRNEHSTCRKWHQLKAKVSYHQHHAHPPPPPGATPSSAQSSQAAPTRTGWTRWHPRPRCWRCRSRRRGTSAAGPRGTTAQQYNTVCSTVRSSVCGTVCSTVSSTAAPKAARVCQRVVLVLAGGMLPMRWPCDGNHTRPQAALVSSRTAEYSVPQHLMHHRQYRVPHPH